MRFAFRIGDHFGLSDGADKDLATTQILIEAIIPDLTFGAVVLPPPPTGRRGTNLPHGVGRMEPCPIGRDHHRSSCKI
jgi:hypothetical protein